MFKETNDIRYADRFVELADWTLSSRDSETGKKDFTGNSNPCWSTLYGTKPYCEPVHTGYNSAPILEFAWLTKNNPTLTSNQNMVTKGQYYYTELKKGIDYHNRQWKQTTGTINEIRSDEGFYYWKNTDPVDSNLFGGALPHNQQLAMAISHLYMYKLSNDTSYLDKAQRLGRVFYRDLSTSSTGAYLWHYWWGKALTTRSNKYEDVSHAGLSLLFVQKVNDLDINIGTDSSPIKFDATKMMKFVNTFNKNIWRNNTSVKFRLDGTLSQDASDMTPANASNWSVLAKNDTLLASRITTLITNNNLVDGRSFAAIPRLLHSYSKTTAQ
jgi:hypothetical protein